MTTPLHSVMSVVIMRYISPEWYFLVLAGFLGSLPDLIRFLQRDWNDWSSYNEIHKLTLRNLLIPFVNLHIILDALTHRNGKWAWWAYPLEILGWGLCLMNLGVL